MNDTTRKRLEVEAAMFRAFAKAKRLGFRKEADLVTILTTEMDRAGFVISRKRNAPSGVICATCGEVFSPTGMQLVHVFKSEQADLNCMACTVARDTER